MNCLEFRRQKLVDPRRLSAEALAHAGGCAACAAFAREVDETETALDGALQIAVPEGLADRIIFQSRRPRPAWRAWALAASVLLAVALGSAYIWPPQTDVYARLAIEHVLMDPESRSIIRDADATALSSTIQRFGGTIKAPIGRVRYITPCPVPGSGDWHIVFEGPRGLVTLVLVPDKRLRTAGTADENGWHALVRPTSFGYYAVVTDSAQATSEVDQLLQERLDWRA